MRRQHRGFIYRETNSDIISRVSVRQLLGPDPVKRTVAAVVNVDDDLMGELRVLPNAAYAQLEQIKVVPTRD